MTLGQLCVWVIGGAILVYMFIYSSHPWILVGALIGVSLSMFLRRRNSN